MPNCKYKLKYYCNFYNQKRNFHTSTQGSLSKLVLGTVSLFAAPRLSGSSCWDVHVLSWLAVEKKFLPMFTQAGNARTTTGTLECLTAVYPTIETVGGGPVRLLTAFSGDGNLVWCWGRFEGANRAFFTGFASSVLATGKSWAWSWLNPRFMRTTVF